MSTPEKHHHAQQNAAAQAIHELRILARDGDAEAVAAIRNIALHAITVLDCLELGDVAKHSHRWPVAYNAIKEIRESDMKRAEMLEVGSAIGIKLAGKNRGFSHNQHTGFAHDLFASLDTIRRNPSCHLHPADLHPELAEPGVLTKEQLKRNWRNLAALLDQLSAENLDAWTEAAFELCQEYCMDDWNRFPWPECVNLKAAETQELTDNPRGFKSAVKTKIKNGLKSLIP